MPTLTVFYLLPAGVFLAAVFLWYVGGRLPRLFAVLPVASCYIAAAALLFGGGMCHRVAHVKLSGLEMDLVDRAGKERQISLGGASKGDRADAGLEIPGLPPEALTLALEKGQMKILPGPGYQRGILVRSGGRLVPLEEGGVPRLLPLQNGDAISVPADEGGDVIAQWKLGKARTELEVTPQLRWIGSAGQGTARLSNLPAQVLGLKLEKNEIILTQGIHWMPELGVQVNGQRLAFREQTEVRVPYLPGVTTLALVKAEPLAGKIIFTESAPPVRRAAFLDWQSRLTQAVAFPFEMEVGRQYRIGGTHTDDVFVKGIPAGVLTLTVDAAGVLTLDLSKDGREAVEEGLLTGQYPQTAGVGQALRLGVSGLPYSGTFHLLEAVQAPEKPVATVSEVSESGLDPTTLAVPVTARWRCAWQPAIQTRWPLPNRTISLPLVDVPVDLFTRRTWIQRVFPLNQLAAREGSLRSVIAYTPDHSAWVNGASLLQLDPGLSVMRTGKPLTADSVALGILDKNAKLEILQVLAETDGGRLSSSLGHPLHPATITTQQRVTLRRRFASIRVITETRGSREVPVLRVDFEKPQIRSVSMTEVKKDLAAREEENRKETGFFAFITDTYTSLHKAWNGVEGIKFAINDRSSFSEQIHHLTFPLLTRSFDDANADVEMLSGEFTVQDDFKRQTLEYGDPFEIGGADRLQLTLIKETVPTGRLFGVALAGGVATAIAWVYGASFWWMALQFGVSFLTCSRVLFGQAVLVNPPFNPEVVNSGMVALLIAPVVLGVGMFLFRSLLPGRIELRLQRLEQFLSYRWLGGIALAFLIVRIILLGGFGAKEAISLGGFRVALSVFFVPAYLVLFAQACQILWRDKEDAGGLRTRVITRFTLITLWLFGCQSVTALITSDLGMFLYFMPMALVLAAVGACALWEGLIRSLRVSREQLKQEKPWLAGVAGFGLVMPLLMMALVFTAPRALLNAWPGLLDEMDSDVELVTDSTLLRVLQFANEDYLINLGTDTAERIAQDHAIMANYAHRGLFGEGYLNVEVLSAKSVTALNDNVSAVFIFAQFGVVGALVVLIAYLAVMLGALGAQERINSLTSWLALLSGMSFALVSLYMMAANYGLLPFTGRNMYLLGLNSWSDIAESFVLLLLILLGIARAGFRNKLFEKPTSTVMTDMIEGNDLSPSPLAGLIKSKN